MDKEEAEIKAQELVELALEAKEISSKIRELKGELMDYCDEENLNDFVWQVDNGYVELKTETKYKLADIPIEFKIDQHLDIANDVASKAFKTKVSLTKEGRRLFFEQHPSIVNLMIPKLKKFLKVNI